jgi:hypothetical protein
MTREPALTGDPLLRRVVGGDCAAAGQVVRLAPTSQSAPLLVTAAVLTGSTDYLDRASATSVTTRERQLTALVRAHLAGDADRLGALVRDHLVEHPDDLLAAWIAGRAVHRPEEGS